MSSGSLSLAPRAPPYRPTRLPSSSSKRPSGTSSRWCGSHSHGSYAPCNGARSSTFPCATPTNACLVCLNTLHLHQLAYNCTTLAACESTAQRQEAVGLTPVVLQCACSAIIRLDPLSVHFNLLFLYISHILQHTTTAKRRAKKQCRRRDASSGQKTTRGIEGEDPAAANVVPFCFLCRLFPQPTPTSSSLATPSATRKSSSKSRPCSTHSKTISSA